MKTTLLTLTLCAAVVASAQVLPAPPATTSGAVSYPVHQVTTQPTRFNGFTVNVYGTVTKHYRVPGVGSILYLKDFETDDQLMVKLANGAIPNLYARVMMQGQVDAKACMGAKCFTVLKAAAWRY